MTLAAHCLSKRYAGARGYQAVRGASLELAAGEFVSIVGRSGSGKSTLLAMLGALAEPSEGKVLIGNTDIWKLQEAERATVRSRGIGFVFQFPSLVSNLSVVDNVALPALLGRTMDGEQAYARAYDLIDRLKKNTVAEARAKRASKDERPPHSSLRRLRKLSAPPVA